MSIPSTEVGPGFLAFITFFFLAGALWLLMRNMFTRMRRMSLAERAEAQRQAEAPKAEEPGDADDSDPRTSDPHDPGRRDSGLGDGPEEGERRGDEV